MFKFILSPDGKYYYAEHNHTIRADLNGNVYGGGGDDDGGDQEAILYSQSPEYEQQMKLFKELQEPYMKSQYGLYTDVFEPQMRSLGATLGEQLSNPSILPEETWNNIWQQARERSATEYGTQRQQATERAAGSGMLGQGPSEQAQLSLQITQGKSAEDIAINQAITEATQKINAKQQSISNMMQYLGYQPSFNLNMPSSLAYTNPEYGQDQGTNWGGLIGGGLGAIGGAFLGGPAGATAGYTVGSGMGSYF